MSLVNLLYPKKCLECGKSGSYICTSCINKLQNLKQICIECGRPSVDGMTHIKCLRPRGLDGLIFIWPYGGVVRKALLKLKYNFASRIANELADYTVSFLRKRKVVLPQKSVLLPIPLYWYRENWRGFNQSGEVAKNISSKMKWDFDPDILVRKRLKRPQAKLKRKERSKNILGVFALNPRYSSFIVHNSIILFDDVFTTGSTLKEAAKVLKRNGARKVWGLTLAR